MFFVKIKKKFKHICKKDLKNIKKNAIIYYNNGNIYFALKEQNNKEI